MNKEINASPVTSEPQELRFREEAMKRLLEEHKDMQTEQVEQWLDLLNDSDPRGRLMAATAVHTMMEVREWRRKGRYDYGT